jgi:hypothetical protein
VPAVENGAVDPREDEEGGQDEEWNRGCAWLRMNAKCKVERQETEDKIKHNLSSRYRTNAEEFYSIRCIELLSYK